MICCFVFLIKALVLKQFLWSNAHILSARENLSFLDSYRSIISRHRSTVCASWKEQPIKMITYIKQLSWTNTMYYDMTWLLNSSVGQKGKSTSASPYDTFSCLSSLDNWLESYTETLQWLLCLHLPVTDTEYSIHRNDPGKFPTPEKWKIKTFPLTAAPKFFKVLSAVQTCIINCHKKYWGSAELQFFFNGPG